MEQERAKMEMWIRKGWLMRYAYAMNQRYSLEGDFEPCADGIYRRVWVAKLDGRTIGELQRWKSLPLACAALVAFVADKEYADELAMYKFEESRQPMAQAQVARSDARQAMSVSNVVPIRSVSIASQTPSIPSQSTATVYEPTDAPKIVYNASVRPLIYANNSGRS